MTEPAVVRPPERPADFVRLRVPEPPEGFGDQVVAMRAWLCGRAGPGRFRLMAGPRGAGGLRTIELPDAHIAAAFLERFGLHPV